MATAEVGALRVVLGLDSAAFTNGLNAAQKELKKVGTQMQRTGQSMAMVGTAMTAAVTAPLLALGVQFTRAAIDAEEMQSAFNVSFGAMAADTRKWAQTTGDAMGRSTFELQKMALGFNGLFKAGGPVTAQTVEMSREFTKLAQDLSSFFNVAEDEAFTALRSGLSGEAEPLRKFNVYLTEASVKAQAYAMGIAKVGSELTEQQKIQARAALIMKGTAEAQGDVIRTSAGTQNQLRTLKSQWAELSVTLGQAILPVITPIVSALNKMATAFSTLSPAMQSTVLVVGAFAAAAGPALIVIGGLVAAFGALATSVAAGGVLAFLPAFAAAAAPFVAAGAAVAAAIYLFRDDLGPILTEFGQAAKEALGPALTGAMTAGREAFAALQAAGAAAAPIVKAFAEAMIGGFGPILITALRTLAATVTSVFDILTQALRVVGAVLRGDWAGAWDAAGSLVMSVIRSIGRIAEAVFPGITGFVRRMVEGVTTWLKGRLFDVLNGVISKVKGVSDAFFRLYDAVVGNSYVPDMVEGVAAWMAKLDAGMVVPARNATDATKQAFERLRDDVANIMDRLLTDTERAARQLAAETKIINDAVNAGQLTRGQGDAAIAGVAGLGLQGITLPDMNPLGRADLEIAESLRGGVEKAQSAFDDAARRFGDEFAYNMDRVLRGDIKGAFLDMLSTVLRSSLTNIGAGLFKSASGGQGFSWANVGSSIGNWFKSLPGFATGGTFKVGGAGGIDSQLMQFRATPGEMADIRRPGQTPEARGSSMHFDLRGAVMTADLLRQMEGMALTSGGAAFKGARNTVPADLAKRSKYRTR